MKTRISFLFAGLMALGLASLMGGCATSHPNKQARVCPQCQTMTVTRTIPVFEGEGNVPPRDVEVTETEHSCPGCQDALTTFFKEGSFQHRCSICEREGFYCPISHR